MGSQRKGAGAVSLSARKPEQKSGMDLRAGRRLLQPARRRDEGRAGDAQEGAKSGKPEADTSAQRAGRWGPDRHCPGRPGCGLCSRI